MPGVLRVGDANVGGGLVMEGDPTVLVNGRPIALLNAPVTPHPPCPKDGKHCNAKTAGNPPQIYVNGKRIATWPSNDTCGHARITGSLDVRFGG